ncbi:MAG TPA: Na+/H+ antiporter subunit D, partial [Spirochaetia bacterium]|nr:Na+/H+ antiporter subunit D [Spirochaetia bacterium]
LFSGFWGKLDLIRAAIASGGIAAVGIAAVLLATVIEGVYFMKIAHSLFEPSPEAGADAMSRQAARPYAVAFLAPALILAAATLVLGVMPGLIDPWLSSATAELLHPASGYAAHIVTLGGVQ